MDACCRSSVYDMERKLGARFVEYLVVLLCEAGDCFPLDLLMGPSSGLAGFWWSFGSPFICCDIHSGYFDLGCIGPVSCLCLSHLARFVWFLGSAVLPPGCPLSGCRLLSLPPAIFLMLVIASGLHPCVVICLRTCSGLTVLNLWAI